MNIIWHSAHPLVPGGYANQTRITVPRLRDAGHHIAVSAFNGLKGAVERWDGISVFGGGLHRYGADVLPHHAKLHFGGDPRAGVVITLMDVFALAPTDALKELNIVAWVPVDHDPLPPRVKQWLHETQALPIAFSSFGEKVLQEAGFYPLYVPHSIDTTVFHVADQVAARRLMDFPPDAFVVGVVAANLGAPGRKCFPEMLLAFAQFHAQHRDSILYLHTTPNSSDPFASGVDIPALVAQLGLPEGSVQLPDPYTHSAIGFPDSYMAVVYNSIDVLLATSRGEGFGLPVLEAQACGTGVITTGFGASLELTANGWPVRGYPFYTEQASWQRIPVIEEIRQALNSAYDERGGESEPTRRAAGLALASQYGTETVFERCWQPALQTIESRHSVLP